MHNRPCSIARRLLSGCAVLAVLAGLFLVGLVRVATAAQAALPSGFSDTVVLSGLYLPTAMAFGPDGSIVIAEKTGQIWSYKSFADTAPTLVADLSQEVDNYWDRGLLGLALPSDYPNDNHIYVMYTRDAQLGGTPPLWNDACPTPPGPTTDGCVVSSRLAQLTISNGVSVSEQPLIDGWCQQYPSHSAGTVAFGPDGYLYASGGDGASFNGVDYGQLGGQLTGDTPNPCGDPPGAAGTALSPPAAEGGALRTQSVRRTDGPTVLNGSIIRVDPATGNAAAGNPYGGDADANRARVLAYGLRNPFRFTSRPGTNELWIGDVGMNTWEEIDRIPDVTAGTALNFGWPCYEGTPIQPGYQAAGLTSCQTLYNTPGSTVAPYFAYNHTATLTPNDSCPTGGSSITGLAFYSGSGYPSSYQGALFFADHTRQCLWAMLPNATGAPDPSNVVSFGHVAHPVQMLAGPATMQNDLFYVDMEDGQIHRLSYATTNLPPNAVANVTPANGATPLTVSYDASRSSDPQQQALTYSWNFGDGVASTSVSGTHTYTVAGNYTATLTVTDSAGLSAATTAAVFAGARITNLKVQVSSPDGTVLRSAYRVRDRITVSATAVDSFGHAIAASFLSWHLSIHHCFSPTNCHTHDGGTISQAAKGYFAAPDHDYPCYLTVELTVTQPGTTQSITRSVRVNPQMVNMTFTTNRAPAPLSLVVDGTSTATPFTRTMVVGHLATISAPTPQFIAGHRYDWHWWSDGKAATHTIVAPLTAATRTAGYSLR